MSDKLFAVIIYAVLVASLAANILIILVFSHPLPATPAHHPHHHFLSGTSQTWDNG